MPRYIDEDALINQIEKAYCEPCEAAKRDYNHVRCRACEAEDMLDWIVDAPTADVAPVVHGEWIEYECSAYDGVDGQGNVRWISKKKFLHESCGRFSAIRERFCPKCGARMDG